MPYLRPISPSDLGQLIWLAEHFPPGFTSLPKSPAHLAKKLEGTLHHTVGTPQQIAMGQRVLLGLFDDADDRLIGISGFQRTLTASAHYLQQPDGTLRLDRQPLGEIRLGSLFLHPEWRRRGLAPLLSRARLLYLALHWPEMQILYADLRGPTRHGGDQPAFWTKVSAHFYPHDFCQMDQIRGEDEAHFIHHYLPLADIPRQALDPELISQLGNAAADARGAMHLLLEEGFVRSTHVDVLDGGPSLIGKLPALKAVREAKPYTLYNKLQNDAAPRFLIAHGRGEHFRACLCQGETQGQNLLCSPEVTEYLALGSDAQVIATPSS